jgi:fatty-acyl-CoA synthase
MNLGQLLQQTALLFPQHIGLIHADRQWTWCEMNARVNAMACALQTLGVRKGDRILVQSRNNLQMFESCWVAFRLGCVWVPTNFRLTPPEVAYLGASSGAAAMIIEDVFESHAQSVLADCPDMKSLIWIGQKKSTAIKSQYEY